MSPRCLRVAIVVSALMLWLPCAYAAKPWDEPFSKDVKAILDAAQQVSRPDNSGVIILLEETRIAIHGEGKQDAISRRVYRITQQSSVAYWSNPAQAYQPWRQQKPAIRARTIAPDGTVHSLDPASQSESPARENSSMFSDTRVVRAPLPSVTVGSIVECEIVVHDNAPLFAAGTTSHIAVNDFVAMERFHVVVETDPGVSMQVVAKLVPDGTLHRTENGKGSRVECDWGPIEKRKTFEVNLPPEVPAWPYLAISTGKSWQAVAAAYGAVVTQRLQSSDWKSILDGVDLQGEPKAVAARLTARLHSQVRYTGMELGDGAILPGAPGETVRRGYGDCKDKAALLVAMLRAAGLKADVALLNAGLNSDMGADLPGMGEFNHAIVYVASTPPLWIDATASTTRVGFLPEADQGRMALIANGETGGLVKTPEASSSDNQRRRTLEVTMSDFGPGTLRETLELSGGSFESNARASYGAGAQILKEGLTKYVKQNYAAKALGKFDVPSGDDLMAPLRTSVEALETRSANTGPDDAAVALMPWFIFDLIPADLRPPQGAEQDPRVKNDEARKHDYLFTEPYQAEVRYRIVPPALFKVAKMPEPSQVKLGPATYSRSFHVNADGSFEALFQFDSGPRRYTPSDLEAFEAGVKLQGAKRSEVISFYPATAEYVALGQMSKAIALVRESIAAHPDSAMAHVRLSRLLITAHLGGAARDEARRATELDGKSAMVWQALAWTYRHDTFGRAMQGNWDRAEAERCYRKALELDPDDNVVRTDLAVLLEHNTKGWRYAKDARLAESIALYREILQKQPDAVGVPQNLAVALLRAGQLDEAKAESRKAPAEVQRNLLAIIGALQEGPAGVIVASQTTFPDPAQRAQFLAVIGTSLIQLRQYPEASVILNAAVRLSSAPGAQAQLDLLTRTKRWESSLLPEDDPRWPLQKLLVELARNSRDAEAYQPFLSKRAHFADWQGDLELQLNSLAAARNGVAASGLTNESLVDSFLSVIELNKSGDEAHGYRFTISAPGVAGSGMPTYVVREDGKFRVLSIGAGGLGAVGALVLELAAKNDIAGAQWWLDRVIGDVPAYADGPGLPAFKSMWTGVTLATRGAAAIRMAATVLMATMSGSAKAIQALQAERPKAANPLEKAQLDKAMCEGLLRARKWDALLIAAKELGTSKMFSEEAFRYQMMAAQGAHKWLELGTEAKRRYDGNHANVTALRAVALAEAGQGHWAQAAEWADKGEGFVGFAVEVAETQTWTALVAGKASDQTLSTLHKVKVQASKQASYQYTDALLLATLRKPDEAMDALVRGIATEDFAHLHAAAWAAYGRICAQYGFPVEAEKALAMARTASQGNDDLTAWTSLLLTVTEPVKH